MMNIASHIEHTLLKATASPNDIMALCQQALEHNFVGVCLHPHYIELAKQQLADSAVRIVTVVGFPLGANLSSTKALEAAQCVAKGAHDIDMVINLGAAKAGQWRLVEQDISEVRRAIGGATLKVILETGYLSPSELQRAAEAALEGGADFLKTSTGFGPRGASVEDVQQLVDIAAGSAQIKASGGISNWDIAQAMLQAGAQRLGTSSGLHILQQNKLSSN